MWLAAAPSSGPGTITIAIITALGFIVAAAIAGAFTLKGTSKSRAVEFDKRVDQELDDARARIVILEQANGVKDLAINDLHNRLIYAKYQFALHKLDPTLLDKPEAGRGRAH